MATKMAAEKLSPEELRKALKAYGVNCGPITSTTHSVYVRKLNTLRSEDGVHHPKPDPPRRSSTGRPASITPSRTSSTNNRSSLGRFSDESDGEEDAHPSYLSESNNSVKRRSRNSLMSTDCSFGSNAGNNNGYDTSALQRPSIRSYTPSPPAINNRTTPSTSWMSKNGSSATKQKPVQGTSADPSASSWQMVSTLLLVFGLGLICALIAAYFFVLRGPASSAPAYVPKYDVGCGEQSALSTEVFHPNCSMEGELKLLDTIVDDLMAKLSRRAGEYDCGYRTDRRDMNKLELLHLVNNHLQNAGLDTDRKAGDYIETIFEIFRVYGNMGIVVVRPSSSEDHSSTDLSLESKFGQKSVLCRFMLSARSVFVTLAIIVLIAVCGICVVLLARYRRAAAEAERQEVYDLVERIVDMLRQNAAASEAAREDPSGRPVPSYLAIPHVRDVLIPLNQRLSKQHIWEQAVNFINSNESRIRVENQKISGEEFAVWRWIQPPVDGTKVWQGQAFGESSASGAPSRQRVAASTNALTTCLKVRNMFDATTETGTDWQTTVRDAVLDKCSGARIVHMAFDTSTADSCTYIRCADLQSAGLCFKALHGWWFDTRLVTVKYIRETRHEERFPESRGLTEPLKPSSPNRISLSQPFHSSAIENL